MIKYLLPLLLALCPSARAAEDCAKSLDACDGTRVSSPFAAASLKEPLPPPVSGGKKAAVRQAAPPAAAAPSPEAVPAAAPQAAPERGPAAEQLGSPLWLLFVGTVLAGLYFYLGAGRRKGRRK